MDDCIDSENIWDLRERYEQTPNRYKELASMKSVGKLFTLMGNEWKEKRKWINYVDLGCGEGKGTKVFSEFLEKTTGLPLKVTGVDASIKCEALCKERGINFLRLQLGLDSLQIRDCQVFTLFETIEHIFNTDYLLKSIRNSISDDGVLLITTLNVACLKNRIMVPLGIQPFNTEVSTKKLSYGYRFKFLKERMDSWKPAGHIRPFTLYSLCDLLIDNDFSIVTSYGLENWHSLKFLEKIAKNACTGVFVIAKPS